MSYLLTHFPQDLTDLLLVGLLDHMVTGLT